MVYGNGVDGNQSSAPNVGIANRGQHSDFGFAEAVQNVFRRRQLENETSVAGATREKLLADSALSQAKYLDVMEDVARKDATYQTYVDQMAANLAHTNQAIAESQQRVNESTQRVSNMQSTANLLQEQIKYWKAHAENEANYMPDLLRNRAFQALQSGKLSEAQIPVAQSLVKLNDAKIQQIMQVIENLKLDGGIKAIEYELEKSMKEIGMTGLTPKDFLILLKDLLITFMKN